MSNHIALSVNGVPVTCNNGVISCKNYKMRERIKKAALVREEVEFGAPMPTIITASDEPDDIIGLFAAMISPSPGRFEVVVVPDDVMALLRKSNVYENADRDGLILLPGEEN